jgi:glutamine cyclotransferase
MYCKGTRVKVKSGSSNVGVEGIIKTFTFDEGIFSYGVELDNDESVFLSVFSADCLEKVKRLDVNHV